MNISSVNSQLYNAKQTLLKYKEVDAKMPNINLNLQSGVDNLLSAASTLPGCFTINNKSVDDGATQRLVDLIGDNVRTINKISSEVKVKINQLESEIVRLELLLARLIREENERLRDLKKRK